jgi:hypothetical protein
LNHTLITASHKEIQKRFSNETEAKLEWVRLHYGEKLADGLNSIKKKIWLCSLTLQR